MIYKSRNENIISINLKIFYKFLFLKWNKHFDCYSDGIHISKFKFFFQTKSMYIHFPFFNYFWTIY